MKRFKDLTELEIKDLSYTDILRFANIECAEKGIAFVSHPSIPEYAKEVPADIKVFGIDGYPSVYIYFSIEEEAKKVCDLLNECSIFCDRDMNPEKVYFVKPIMKRSESAAKLQKEVDEINEKLKTDYDAALSEYEEYEKKWYAELRPIEEKYYSIIEKYNRLDLIKSRYTEMYIPLADGDEEIAKKFLTVTYTLTEEEKEYIFDARCKQEAGGKE